MKLTIDIDLDAIADDPAGETGKILRSWAGALSQMDLSAEAEHAVEAEHTVMNSTYGAEVGTNDLKIHRSLVSICSSCALNVHIKPNGKAKLAFVSHRHMAPLT